MSKTAWALIAAAYVIGALGLAIALTIISNQQDTIEDNTERLEAQSMDNAETIGALCVAISQPSDIGENLILRQLADPTQSIQLTPVCREITDRIIAE